MSENIVGAGRLAVMKKRAGGGMGVGMEFVSWVLISKGDLFASVVCWLLYLYS